LVYLYHPEARQLKDGGLDEVQEAFLK